MDRHRRTTSRRAGKWTDTDYNKEGRQMDRQRCTSRRAGRWTDRHIDNKTDGEIIGNLCLLVSEIFMIIWACYTLIQVPMTLI